MSKAENSKKEKLKALKKAEKKMKKRKNHTAKKIAAGAGITVAVLLAAGYGAVGYYYQDKFYPGTRINGSACGGMQVAEIKEMIKKSAVFPYHTGKGQSDRGDYRRPDSDYLPG